MVVAKTELVTGQPHDARCARLDHLNRDPTLQPKLMQSVNVTGITDNLVNLGELARPQHAERNQVYHCRCLHYRYTLCC